MISTFEATEMRCIDYHINKRKYDFKILYEIKTLLDVYPNNKETLGEFYVFYLECIKSMHVIAILEVKNEEQMINKYCSKV